MKMAIFRLKTIVKKMLQLLGYKLTSIQTVPSSLPDREYYTPIFSPWLGYKEFHNFYEMAKPRTLVSPASGYVLYSLSLNALRLEGEFWECGVYKGGTARMLAGIIEKNHKSKKVLRLFDTFSGMPETDREKDFHAKGDFGDCSCDDVRGLLDDKDFIFIHKGFMPSTFMGLEKSKIAFAHIDVDIYQSVFDCCQFLYPLLVPGGFVVFDDYGLPTCPGARLAVDRFFTAKPETPIILPTGQAIVIKLPSIAQEN